MPPIDPNDPDAIPTTRCLYRITGTIEKCRGIRQKLTRTMSRCYVKGIKGNSHLVAFFCTDACEGQNPAWNANWEIDCAKIRSRDEFVGLKFVVYDGEEFIGGTDLDLSEIADYQEVHEELELAGIQVFKAKGYQPKKARLFISVSVERRMMPVFGHPQKILLASMRSIVGVTSLCGRIVRARGLANSRDDDGISYPMVFVRCYMNSGRLLEIYNTQTMRDIHDPTWNETFEYDFEEDDTDQPLMLVYDIFSSGGVGVEDARFIFQAGDHLGSARIAVDGIGDEDAFINDKSRQRLRLLGDSQLFERRLDKDANVASDIFTSQEGESDAQREKRPPKEEPKPSLWQRLRRKKMPEENEQKFNLTVELFAERGSKPMPHEKLMDEAIVVERADAAEYDDPDIVKMFEADHNGDSVKRLNIRGEERIVSVYGRIISGTDLIGADVSGKSDAYVIVEAVTRNGDKHFMYRTRVIKSNLNPSWGEGFFYQVPADPDNPKIPVALSKVQFTVFDSDEGQTLEMLKDGGDDGDDFLGRCGVDVSSMRNSDFLLEEVPLLGVKKKAGAKPNSSFRRYSTLNVEVRVERRVQRIIDAQHQFDADLLDCPRHHDSRTMLPPEFKGYTDYSQVAAVNDPGVLSTTAAQVVNLRESNMLLVAAKANKLTLAGWLEFKDVRSWSAEALARLNPPPSNSLGSGDLWEESNEGDEEQFQFRRDWRSLTQNWDHKLREARDDKRNLDHVNRLPPMVRNGSLPMLSTRFGNNYEKNIMDPFEEHIKRLTRYHAPEFPLGASRADTRATEQSMRSKPAIEDCARRTLRAKGSSSSVL